MESEGKIDSPGVKKSVKVRPLSSSLLKNTAATAAKSKAPGNVSTTKPKTPLLGRKPSAGRKATPVIQRKGLPNNDSTKKVKKIAVSSFIGPEDGPPEDHLPDRHEWDASAIAGPNLHSSVSSNENTSIVSRDNESVLVSSCSDRPGQKAKTLLKSHLVSKNLAGIKTNQDKGPKGPLKVIHPTNSSANTSNRSNVNSTGTCCQQSEVNLHDDYLMSELMRLNARRAKEQMEREVDKEVTSLWSALELLKSEVQQRDDVNRELEEKLRVIKTFRSIRSQFQDVKDRYEGILEASKDLVEGLNHSRNRLEVKGSSSCADEDVQALIDTFHQNIKIMSKGQGFPDLDRVTSTLEDLSKGSADACSSFDRCKEDIDLVNKLTVKQASLKETPNLEIHNKFIVECAIVASQP